MVTKGTFKTAEVCFHYIYTIYLDKLYTGIEEGDEEEFFQADVYVIVVGVSCGVALAVMTVIVISLLLFTARKK